MYKMIYTSYIEGKLYISEDKFDRLQAMVQRAKEIIELNLLNAFIFYIGDEVFYHDASRTFFMLK